MKKYKVPPKERKDFSIIRLLNNKPSTYSFAIFDNNQMRVIGLDTTKPTLFFNKESTQIVIDGLEEGRVIFGMDVIHCDGDVYKMEGKTNE